MTQPPQHSDQAYADAQSAIAMLKSAIYRVLLDAGQEGLSNAQIGRRLGIYTGHKGHEGHIPRTLLGIKSPRACGSSAPASPRVAGSASTVVSSHPPRGRWLAVRSTSRGIGVAAALDLRCRPSPRSLLAIPDIGQLEETGYPCSHGATSSNSSGVSREPWAATPAGPPSAARRRDGPAWFAELRKARLTGIRVKVPPPRPSTAGSRACPRRCRSRARRWGGSARWPRRS